jgi:hypothetical protein
LFPRDYAKSFAIAGMAPANRDLIEERGIVLGFLMWDGTVAVVKMGHGLADVFFEQLKAHQEFITDLDERNLVEKALQNEKKLPPEILEAAALHPIIVHLNNIPDLPEDTKDRSPYHYAKSFSLEPNRDYFRFHFEMYDQVTLSFCVAGSVSEYFLQGCRKAVADINGLKNPH